MVAGVVVVEGVAERPSGGVRVDGVEEKKVPISLFTPSTHHTSKQQRTFTADFSFFLPMYVCMYVVGRYACFCGNKDSGCRCGGSGDE